MPTSDINLTPTAACFDIEFSQSGLPQESKQVHSLPARSWGNLMDCQGGVLLVHGLGATSAWFEPLARRLKVRGLFALSYDQVGFGRRRHEKFVTAEQWFDDVRVAFHYLKKHLVDKPIFIVGNSMGGLISLYSADQLNADGLVMLSPGLEGNPRTFTLGYRIATFCKALLDSDCDYDLPYDLEKVSEVESVRRWLENDPEKRFSVSGRMLLQLLAMTQQLKYRKLSLQYPLLMMTAGRDAIVDNRVNNELFKRIGGPEKEKVCFEDSPHDLTLNPVLDEVAERISSWIFAHSARRAVTN